MTPISEIMSQADIMKARIKKVADIHNISESEVMEALQARYNIYLTVSQLNTINGQLLKYMTEYPEIKDCEDCKSYISYNRPCKKSHKCVSMSDFERR